MGGEWEEGRGRVAHCGDTTHVKVDASQFDLSSASRNTNCGVLSSTYKVEDQAIIRVLKRTK